MTAGDGQSGRGRPELAGSATPPAGALDRVTDAFVVLDGEWRVTYANRPAVDLLGEPAGALRGATVWDAVPGLADTEFETRFREAMASQEPAVFEARYGPTGRWIAVRAYPSATGLSVYARDVTERLERERRIREQERQLRTVVESSTDAIILKDLDGRYVLVNEAVAEGQGRPRREILGRTDAELFGEAAGGEFWARDVLVHEIEARTICETELPTPRGDRIYETHRSPYYGPDDELAGTVCVCRDVTDRKARERDLRRYETLVETSPDPMFALDGEFRVTLVNRAMERLTGVEREDVLGKPAAVALAEGVVTERQFEDGVETVTRLLDDGDVDYEKLEVPMRTADGERIVAEYHLGTVAGGDDGGGVVGVVRDVSDHLDQQAQIRRQRDELETLARINELVQDAIGSVVEAATREEIEAMVCRRLADSEFYAFAWVAERESNRDGLGVRTVDGVEAADVEAVLAGYDGADATDPVLAAMETGELQVSQDFLDDPDVPPPVVAEIPEGSVRSGVAVPLGYDEVVYGVLGVVAPRPGAFSERELAAFEVLGDTVGFAINATGNRRLLFGDAAVEVEFRVEDPSSPLVALSTASDCDCAVERVVPTGDGGALHYLAVEGASASAAAEFLAGVDGVSGVRRIRGDGTGAFLEFRATGTVPARLAATGATPGRTTVADGAARVTAEVPPNADLHAVVAAFRVTFPESAVVAKRFVDRPPGSVRTFEEAVADRLTDRQRAALRAALCAGYYEWPRESTAEEVADSLDISSATLHYHLRRAEETLVETFLDEDD